MMEVRQARYFIAVAEELHFGRAAERLHMSQPPLSQAIMALENQLGTELLHRTSRRVQVTETGRMFLDECRLLVRASERAVSVATLASSGMVGTLRIGAVTSAFNDPLPAILKEFREGWPEVELQAREIDTHDGQDALMRGEIDVAVIRLSVGDRHITSIPLRQDRFVLALPQDHARAAEEGPVKLADFRDESWVWLNRSISPDYHDELVAACQQSGFRPSPRHYGNSIHSQLAMGACGLGVTLVPASSIHLNVHSVVFKELATRADLVELSLLCRSDITEPLVEQFVQCALAHAG